MKKKVAILIMICMMSTVIGCSEQSFTRSVGGSMTVELEPGQKLELVTWKDDASLWYLTRPMRDDEEPETHIYQQQSEFGIFEGTVTIVESKKGEQ